jgi:FixJ family two-component response regulator
MGLSDSILSKVIFIVTDKQSDLDFLSSYFISKKFEVKEFLSTKEYINQVDDTQGCLIADISIHDVTSSSFLNELNTIEHLSPVILFGDTGITSVIVNSIKLGAFDFIVKPFNTETLLKKITTAIDEFQKNIEIITRYKQLTNKEKKVFICIVKGATNHQMTEKLFISTSTVEKHRASVMKKMEADTLPCLVKMLPMLSPLNIDLEPKWCVI